MSSFRVSDKVVCIRGFTDTDPDIDESRATPDPVEGQIYDVRDIEFYDDGSAALYLTGFIAGHWAPPGPDHGDEIGYDSTHFRRVRRIRADITNSIPAQS